MKNPEILIAIRPVIKTLERLSIPYYIGGSIASSFFGIARATMDVDIIADIKENQIRNLKKSLEKDYYIDENMIREAIQKTSSFNIIHLATIIKIDIFIPKKDSFQYQVFKRKINDNFEDNGLKEKFYFSSAEDIIIFKLQWYELGGGISERQWNDIIGVIKVQNKNLDTDYLKFWSNKFGLNNFLKKAFADAGCDL